MKKTLRNWVLPLAAILLLASCGEKKEVEKATILNAAKDSVYGQITDFNLDLTKEYDVGEVLRFKVTPYADFFLKTVTVNGEAATQEDNGFYSYALKAGQNRVMATYDIDPSVDVVSEFKLNIPDDVFQKAMETPTGASDDFYDFRKDGIEQANMNGFLNYVDGDTTHVETLNYGYTVKLRYLGIDTPESTSEIEEWGKSASLYNQSLWKSAKKVILESQGWAFAADYTVGSAEWEAIDKRATADGNQRSLAYIWYATKDNPEKADFRCLNLEMVYAGFSQGIGSLATMGKSFYLAFDKANLSAQANLRGQFSGKKDPNYYYGKPKDLTLKELYLGGGIQSTYVDQKTLYRINGYVTRKIAGAFYFQDQASYKRGADNALPVAYGMYVFTYAQTDIQPGDYVSVIGALSVYGGSLQMQGISYNTINPDPNRDTMILESGNTIVPIEMTAAEFNASKAYDNVLVTITDDLYCYADETFTEGGIEEINRYNEHYPFYNSSNKLVFFAHAGSKTGKSLRLIEDENILCSYRTEISRSYKFFTGGTNYYNPKGAQYVVEGKVLTPENATTDEEKEIASSLIVTVYKPKIIHFTGISQYYVSTSGKTTTYQLVIANSGDIQIKGVYEA